LRTNKGLQTLSLRNNKIGDLGGEAIANGLQTNGILKYLDLNDNPIGEYSDTPGILLASLITTNFTLRTLELNFAGAGRYLYDYQQSLRDNAKKLRQWRRLILLFLVVSTFKRKIWFVSRDNIRQLATMLPLPDIEECRGDGMCEYYVPYQFFLS
jgi:hypothetical protein